MIDLTEILKNPSLPLVIKQLQNQLEKEAKLREEFYNQINESQKAEFINGEIIMHSPASYGHNLAMKRLLQAMEKHVSMYSIGYVGFEKMMIHLSRNSYEPDICFFTDVQAKRFSKSDKLFPAPALIVEVLSPSTEKNDRIIKFEDYQAHNVHEYWLIDPIEEHVEQYILKNQKYQIKFNANKGLIESEIIAGFKVNAELIFDDDRYYEFLARDTRKIFEQKKQLTNISKQLTEKNLKLSEKDKQLNLREEELKAKDKIIEELIKKLEKK